MPAISLPYAVGSALLFYFASVAIYRLVLHPLANFPGPKLAALTHWYEAYYDVVQNGQYTFRIRERHKIYGPIIRISPFELHINDPSFYGQLYRQDGTWEKYAWMHQAFSAAPKSTFCTIEHSLHRKRRAPLDAFFSKTNVTRRQDIIQSRANKLRLRIQDFVHDRTEFDFGDALAAVATDVATEYILGQSYNNLDRADFNAGMTNMVRGHGDIWRRTKHIPFLGPIMMAMPLSLLERTLDQDGKQFIAYLRNSKAQTEAHMHQIEIDGTAEDESSNVMIHSIINSTQLPPSEKEFTRVHQDVDAVTGAGIETVGQTLRLTCFHIYTNPDILRRLRGELTSISKLVGPGSSAGEPEQPLLGQLERLPYLTAVIKEGLRMSPGIATRMARIAPNRDINYGSWSIPAGTPVGMTVLLMHYDEQLYPDPVKFDPDRWLQLDSNKQGEKIFAPFSKGTRMCVGMHLAWAELYITIATLITTFDIEFIDAKAEDVRPSSDQFVIGTKEKHGPRARAKLLT